MGGNTAIESSSSSGKKRKRKSTKKEKAAKKASLSEDNHEEAKARDFKSDLEEYISNWENKSLSDWKFNKVLQAWAISNVFDSDRIDSKLFKRLCPYLASVQGAAKSRLLETAKDICSSEEHDGATEDSSPDKADSKKKKRAKKLAKILEM